MSDRTTPSAELLLLCGKVRDDALTPEDASRLDELLQASDQAKALYVQYMSVLSLLESRGVAEEIAADDAPTNEQNDQNVLLELLALEEAAYAPIVEMPKVLHLRVAEDKTPWEFGGALRYVISRPATWTAAAAVLVLALILGIVFSGGNQPNNEIAQQPDFTTPNEPDRVGPETTDAVATLTATHDAQWDSQPAEGLRRGSKLHANQTLTLTAGFAEITTNRGAVAILQAPATVELLNHNNAIRLHAGKLVGLCYSESSKGFVVKTDHADIIDLGTEFGVEVTRNQVTTTVFTGEVKLATPGSKPQPLTENQTAQLRVNGVNRKLTVKDQLAQGFEELRTHRMSAATLRNDPAMIAYFGFEADDLADGKLLNRAKATFGRMDGTLGQDGKPDSSPALTEGRRPGTKALRFEAEEFDIVRISKEDAKALDGLEHLTIALWVRPGHMDQMSHHLVTKRAAGGRDVLNFGLSWDGSGSGYAPNTVFFEGRMGQSKDSKAGSITRRPAWMHLVVTYDRGERSIYLDGALLQRLPRQDAGRLGAIDAELLIGAATPHINATETYLDGDLDELFILGRSMSADEIATLHETGVPAE